MRTPLDSSYMRTPRTLLSAALHVAAAFAAVGCAQPDAASRVLCRECDPAITRTDRLPAVQCAGVAATNDVTLKRQLDHAAHTLMEAKKATPVTELIKQLSRRQCKIKPLAPQATALTPAQIYARCKPAVLVVAGLYKCPKCTRWHTGAASGVLIDPAGVFLTSYHVVKNTKNKAIVAMTADGKVYPVAEVLAASESDDVAVVRLGSGGRRFTALPIAAGGPVGSPVTVISHPTNRFYLLTAGIVSRYQKTKRANKLVDMMTITADFGRGSSGGPVLNDRGAVVGMVASTSSVYYPAKKGKTEQLQMVFKQCIPAASILKLLAPR